MEHLTSTESNRTFRDRLGLPMLTLETLLFDWHHALPKLGLEGRERGALR